MTLKWLLTLKIIIKFMSVKIADFINYMRNENFILKIKINTDVNWDLFFKYLLDK